LIIVVSLLLLFALSAIITRVSLQEPGKFPVGDRVYSVTMEATITISKPGDVIKVATPWDTRFAKL
jgi:hypothetical protein